MEDLLFQVNTAELFLPLDAATFYKFVKILDSTKFRDFYLRPHMPDEPAQVFYYEYFATGVAFPDIVRHKFFSYNCKCAVFQLVNNALILFTPTRRLYMEPPPTGYMPVEILPVHARKMRKSIETTFNLAIQHDISLLQVSDRGDVFLIDADNKCWFFSATSAVQQFQSMNYQFYMFQDDVFLTECASPPFYHISAYFLPREKFLSGRSDLMICCCKVSGGIANADILNVKFTENAVIDQKARYIFRLYDQLIETCFSAVSPLGQVCVYINGLLCMCSIDFSAKSDVEYAGVFVDVYKLAQEKATALGQPKKFVFSTDGMYLAVLFEKCIFIVSALLQVPFSSVVRIDNFNNLPVDCQFFSARNLVFRIQGNIIQYCINTPADPHQLIYPGERFALKTMLVNCHSRFAAYLLDMTATAAAPNERIDAFIVSYLDFMDAFTTQLQRVVAPCILGKSADVFQIASQKVMTLAREEQYICNMAQNALVTIANYLFEGCKCKAGVFSQTRLLMLAKCKRGFLSTLISQLVFYRLFHFIEQEFGFSFFKKALGSYSSVENFDYQAFYYMYIYIVTVYTAHNSVFRSNYFLVPFAMAALSVVLDISSSNVQLYQQFADLAHMLKMQQLLYQGIPKLPALLILQFNSQIQFYLAGYPVFYSVNQGNFWLDLFQKYYYMMRNGTAVLKQLRTQEYMKLSNVLQKPDVFKAFIDANLNQDIQTVYSAILRFSQQRLVTDLVQPSELLQEFLIAAQKTSFSLREKCDFSALLDNVISYLPVQYIMLFSTFGTALLVCTGVRQMVYSLELLISCGYMEHAISLLKTMFDAFSETDQRVLSHFKNCLAYHADLVTKTRTNPFDGYVFNGRMCYGEAAQASFALGKTVTSVVNYKLPTIDFEATRFSEGVKGFYDPCAAAPTEPRLASYIQSKSVVNSLKNAVPSRPMVFERISLADIMNYRPGECKNQLNTSYHLYSTPSFGQDMRRCAEEPREQVSMVARHRYLPFFNQAENPIVYQMPPHAVFPQRQCYPPAYDYTYQNPSSMPVFTAQIPNPNYAQYVSVPLLYQSACKPSIPVPLSGAMPVVYQAQEREKSPYPTIYTYVVVKRVKAPPPQRVDEDSLCSDVAGPEVRQRPIYKQTDVRSSMGGYKDYGRVAQLLQQISAYKSQQYPQFEVQTSYPVDSKQPEFNYYEQTRIDELRSMLARPPADLPAKSPAAITTVQERTDAHWMGMTIQAETDVIKPRPQDKYVPKQPHFDLSEHYKQLDSANQFAAEMHKYKALPDMPPPARANGVSSDAGDFSNLSDALRAIEDL